MKLKHKPEEPPTVDELIETASEDSFPASDPPARTLITGVGTPSAKAGKAPTLAKVDRPRPQPKKRRWRESAAIALGQIGGGHTALRPSGGHIKVLRVAGNGELVNDDSGSVELEALLREPFKNGQCLFGLVIVWNPALH